MAPVMECVEVATGVTGMPRAETPSCCTTTLYDLIAALHAVVGPDGDALVVTTVVGLLQSGRLTWRGKGRVRLAEARGYGNHASRDGRQASRPDTPAGLSAVCLGVGADRGLGTTLVPAGSRSPSPSDRKGSIRR
jgi:hypothetical protein